MADDSTHGQFRLITLHHTGSESTPQEVEALHRGQESLHHLGRAIMAGGKPEQYGFADVGCNFLVAPDGTTMKAGRYGKKERMCRARILATSASLSWETIRATR